MTDSNHLIGSDRAPELTEEQRSLIAVLLNLIIPPSDDGRMPGAAEYDVIGYIRNISPDDLPALLQSLEALQQHSRSGHDKPFIDLSSTEQQSLLERMRLEQHDFLLELAQATVVFYYQQDAVLEGIGMQPRAPFPEGYEVKSGDLGLLDPVRDRGKLYRQPE